MTLDDREICAKFMASPDSARAVTNLHHQMRHGDSTTVARAKVALWDFASRRETAAVVRHLKASDKEPTS